MVISTAEIHHKLSSGNGTLGYNGKDSESSNVGENDDDEKRRDKEAQNTHRARPEEVPSMKIILARKIYKFMNRTFIYRYRFKKNLIHGCGTRKHEVTSVIYVPSELPAGSRCPEYRCMQFKVNDFQLWTLSQRWILSFYLNEEQFDTHYDDIFTQFVVCWGCV